jgi:GNAT superfamily N-acetyltransferase
MSMIVPYRNLPAEPLRPISEAWLREAKGNQLGVQMNVDSHLADLQRLATDPHTMLLVLVEEGELPVPAGLIGIELFVNPLGKELVASEKYWFVRPEYRGRNSLRLLQTAREWAKANGATYMLFTASNLASESHDSVCRLYENMKMNKFESTYLDKLDK